LFIHHHWLLQHYPEATRCYKVGRENGKGCGSTLLLICGRYKTGLKGLERRVEEVVDFH